MKLSALANNSKNDEYYTPRYAVKPILKYIKDKSKVWCPFDSNESKFVHLLKENGHNVIYTHIENNEDFFNLDIDCDYIISNPPYSKKIEVLERLFRLKKPFAMLLGIVGLFEGKKFDIFKNNDFEIMFLNRRVSFFKSFSEQKPSAKPAFSSVYICHKILPNQIVFEEINTSTKNEIIENTCVSANF